MVSVPNRIHFFQGCMKNIIASFNCVTGALHFMLQVEMHAKRVLLNTDFNWIHIVVLERCPCTIFSVTTN